MQAVQLPATWGEKEDDMTASIRRLECEGCLNVRDVGGYPTTDGATTRWGALFRADNLCQLTPAGQAALLASGVRTIIDVRLPSEAAASPHPFGPASPHAARIHYRNLPMRDEHDDTLGAALRARRPEDRTLNALILDLCAPGIIAILRAVAEAPPGGVLLHCNIGRDRTGVLVGLLLALVDVPDATIAEDYALSDDNLEPLFAARARAAGVDTLPSARLGPELMLVMLKYLNEAYHGPQAYCLAAGLIPAEITSLRARLRTELH
jgi:protein-tyrosine phosphatase